MGACFTVNLELTFFGLEKHKKRSVGREIVRKY